MRLLRRWTALLALTVSGPILLHAQASLQTATPDDAVASIETLVKNKTSDKATITSLIQVVENSATDIRVRERALWALGQLRAKTAVPTLMEAAKHKGLLIRSAALDALTKLRSRTALPVFINIAENDPILSLRQRATLALGLLQSEKTIPSLVKLSSDKTPEVQGAAALAMAATQSNKNDFTEALKEMAAEEDAFVKERSEVALNIARRKTVAVKEYLSAEDVDVRLFSALYFRDHGTSPDVEALKKAANGEADDDVRYELGQAVAAIKRRAAATKAKQQKASSPNASVGDPRKPAKLDSR